MFSLSTPNAGTSKASQAFWQVEDIEREVAELIARGVKFEKCATPDIDEKGISTAGGAKTCVVQGHRRQHHAADPNALSENASPEATGTVPVNE